jgi:hypothetical protein
MNIIIFEFFHLIVQGQLYKELGKINCLRMTVWKIKQNLPYTSSSKTIIYRIITHQFSYCHTLFCPYVWPQKSICFTLMFLVARSFAHEISNLENVHHKVCNETCDHGLKWKMMTLNSIKLLSINFHIHITFARS